MGMLMETGENITTSKARRSLLHEYISALL